MAQRHSGTLAQGRKGAMVQRRNGSMRNGTGVQRQKLLTNIFLTIFNQSAQPHDCTTT
jgi:hypothetical protein